MPRWLNFGLYSCHCLSVSRIFLFALANYSSTYYLWMSSTNFVIHPFIRQLILQVVPSFLKTFVNSFIHIFIHSYIHLFIHSFIHSFLPSFIHSFIHSLIHKCVVLLARLKTQARIYPPASISDFSVHQHLLVHLFWPLELLLCYDFVNALVRVESLWNAIF